MNFNDIITSIGVNIGSPNLPSAERTVVKRDIDYVINKVLRKSEGLKKKTEFTITTDDSSQVMSDDFLAVREVIFLNSDGNRYFSKEIEYETYLKWRPNIINNTPFGVFDTASTPELIYDSQENFDLDGYVGYTWLDTATQVTLLWKPAIAGTIQVYHSYIPESLLSSLSSSPNFNTAFHDVVIDGVTEKQLIRKFSRARTEIEIVSLRSQIKYYSDNYKESLAEFLKFVNKEAETHRVEPFDFLNDHSMLL